ncbi:hypothetical protein [Propioniciclava soli]|uniref:hypothetical protein n=1 Tax=Propioniciclava soli TaxID=2775081 RepID=UPI001E49B4BD|nr:hypothetical protein [Propioniciclava soli]
MGRVPRRRGEDHRGLTQNNPARTNRADAFDLFKSGRVGMVVGFSPLAGQLDEEGTVNYAVAPMPVNDGGEPPPSASPTT